MCLEGFDLTEELDYLFEKYPNSGEVNYRVENSIGLINKIEKYYEKEGAKIEKLDGLSVEFEDGDLTLELPILSPF
jgi:phosphomannomutase/phosphomannomutase/phosphoglucomutase